MKTIRKSVSVLAVFAALTFTSLAFGQSPGTPDVKSKPIAPSSSMNKSDGNPDHVRMHHFSKEHPAAAGWTKNHKKQLKQHDVTTGELKHHFKKEAARKKSDRANSK